MQAERCGRYAAPDEDACDTGMRQPDVRSTQRSRLKGFGSCTWPRIVTYMSRQHLSKPLPSPPNALKPQQPSSPPHAHTCACAAATCSGVRHAASRACTSAPRRSSSATASGGQPPEARCSAVESAWAERGGARSVVKKSQIMGST